MFEIILKVLQQFQVNQKTTLRIAGNGIIQKRIGNSEVFESKNDHYTAGKLPSTVSKIDHQKIIQVLDKKGIKIKFQKMIMQIGDPFRDYGLFKNLYGQGQTRLTHQKDKVLLVIVNNWGSQSHSRSSNIRFVQQLLQNNAENWKGKVKIVVFNINQSNEFIRDMFQDKIWQNAIHLLCNNLKSKQIRQNFKMFGLSFFVLVNKWGKINRFSFWIETDIQNRINQLILQTKSPQYNKNSIVAEPSKSQLNKYTQNVIKSLSVEQIQKHFQNIDFIVIKYQKDYSLIKGQYQFYFKIQAFVIDGDQDAEDLVKSFFQKNENLQLKVNKVKYLTIPSVKNPQCFICQRNSLQYPYYWLKWEGQNIFGCKECIERKSTIPGHHYFYQQNSILLCGPWSKVAEKDIGMNIQPPNPSQVTFQHNYQCSLCKYDYNRREMIGWARYIDLGSRADPNFKTIKVDLCEQCMKEYIQKGQNVKNALLQEGYTPRHPYLRVLYNVKGYYNY